MASALNQGPPTAEAWRVLLFSLLAGLVGLLVCGLIFVARGAFQEDEQRRKQAESAMSRLPRPVRSALERPAHAPKMSEMGTTFDQVAAEQARRGGDWILHSFRRGDSAPSLVAAAI
jgi:hypothetical protein